MHCRPASVTQLVPWMLFQSDGTGLGNGSVPSTQQLFVVGLGRGNGSPFLVVRQRIPEWGLRFTPSRVTAYISFDQREQWLHRLTNLFGSSGPLVSGLRKRHVPSTVCIRRRQATQDRFRPFRPSDSLSPGNGSPFQFTSRLAVDPGTEDLHT